MVGLGGFSGPGQTRRDWGGIQGIRRERAIRTVWDRCNAATVAKGSQRSTSDAPAPLVRYVRVRRNARRLNQGSSACARRMQSERTAHSYRTRGGLRVCDI